MSSGSTARVRAAVPPRSSPSPTAAGTPSTSPTTSSPRTPCAGSRSARAGTRRSSPSRAPGSPRRPRTTARPSRPPPRGAHRSPGQGPERGRVRCYGAQRTGRRAALPAPLPGRPCRGEVPAALRGGDRDLLPAARNACPAAGDHRPRRRRLHDVHPQDFHSHVRSPPITHLQVPPGGTPHDAPHRRLPTPSSRAWASTNTAGPTPTRPAPLPSAASTRTSSATSPRRRTSRSG